MTTTERYKIVRQFQRDGVSKKTIRRGLTLRQAQEHCNDPETSSSTCTKPEGLALTKQYGNWFDSYYKEQPVDLTPGTKGQDGQGRRRSV